MAATQISDLWIPAVWVQAMRERQATYPALFNSGVVATADLFNTIASGAGNSANVPFLKDITDQSDEVQVEGTAPVNNNNQPGSTQVFPLLNRVTKNSATALAAQISWVQPMDAIIDQLTMRRLKQRQTTLVSQLRGLLGTGATVNGSAAALSAVRLGGAVANAEPFIEDGNAATANQLISPDKIINTKALMGELGDELKNGCLLMHPNVKARLEVLDSLNFKSVIMPSELPWTITTYRDIPIFTSVALARVGTVSGFVYDTYIITKGVVGYGEKGQQGDTTDVASLQYFRDRDLNNELIWDRTRFMLGINGTSWTPGGGVPALQSPSNAELGNPANWSLVFQSANRVGVTAIRTNG
jgi:hypothetical protein